MINHSKGLGDINRDWQQARQMQQALQQEKKLLNMKEFVFVSAWKSARVKEVSIDGYTRDKIADAVSEAVKKTQELAARKFLRNEPTRRDNRLKNPAIERLKRTASSLERVWKSHEICWQTSWFFWNFPALVQNPARSRLGFYLVASPLKDSLLSIR